MHNRAFQANRKLFVLSVSLTLSILALKGGTPARTSTTVVYIEVLDVNDEYPKFSQTQYLGSVKENLAAGQFVTQVDI